MARLSLRLLLLAMAANLLPACGSKGDTTILQTGLGSAQLSAVALSSGTLSPSFTPQNTFYLVGPGLVNSSLTVTPTAADAAASIRVNGTTLASGSASAPIVINPGLNSIVINVTSGSGDLTLTYAIIVVKDAIQGQSAYVKASNTGINDQFGTSAAISGDTIVIGAFGEAGNALGVNAPLAGGSGTQADNSALNAGAAYVYTRTAGGWAQQAYLKASNTNANDKFGISVAISGDTIVVGAYGEASNAVGVNAPLVGGSGTQADNSAGTAGAAYVFTRTAGVWSQQAYLKASNTNLNDGFGYSVAISGDTIVVGAYGESSNAVGVNAPLTGGSGTQADNSAGGAGAAYVFARTAGVWSQEAYLKASNSDGNDYFGFSVAISGNTIVVGAFWEDGDAVGVNAPLTGGSGTQADNSAADAGAAYVFTRTAGVWSQEAYLKASNTDMNDNFGCSVAIWGDTIVVGAQFESSNALEVNAPISGGSGTQADNSAGSAGAAYVFTRTAGVWSQEAYLKASNTDSNDNFGSSVAISEESIVVGALAEASNAAGVHAPLTGASGPQADNSAMFAGAAYVFTRSANGWALQSYLKASNPGIGDLFGISVAIDDDTVLVGAYSDDSNAVGINAPLLGGSGTQADNSAPGAGAAYVFK